MSIRHIARAALRSPRLYIWSLVGLSLFETGCNLGRPHFNTFAYALFGTLSACSWLIAAFGVQLYPGVTSRPGRLSIPDAYNAIAAFYAALFLFVGMTSDNFQNLASLRPRGPVEIAVCVVGLVLIALEVRAVRAVRKHERRRLASFGKTAASMSEFGNFKPGRFNERRDASRPDDR